MNTFPYEFFKGMHKEIIDELQTQGFFPNQLFAVISWGAAATKWLSKTLCSHPDIFCVHAMNNNWISGNNSKFFNKFDGLDYLSFIAKSAFGYKTAGDVHGISRHLVPEIKHVLGNNFNSVVVVREPLPRLQSQLGQFLNFQKHKLWNVDYIDDLLKKYDVVLPKEDYEHKLFVHGVNMLNAITQEINIGKIFKSEDLTTNPVILKEFIKEISNGKINTDDDLISKMLKTEKINTHLQKITKFQFADWQVDVIKSVVLDESWNLYSQLGYEKPDFI